MKKKLLKFLIKPYFPHPYDFSVYESIAELVAHCGYGEKVLVMCEKALAIYDQAISLNLNSAAAYVRKGDIFQIYLERNDDAVAAYDQAALLDPDFTINKASFLYEIARYEEAANAYSQIIKHHPNDPVAHYMKGEANLFTGTNEEALASFEQVLQLDPNDVITHYNKGKALFGCGRYEEALATFKKTISLFEDTSISSSLYNSFYGINSKYDNSRGSGYNGWSLDEIYADICKKYAGLEDFQDALKGLEQYY
ncbi:MAG TPA: tetratricopeptide repeat protein, partial [Methylomirabilota bacterium]|nr:tetratricopeptide repeat protein [Methylomirabilota bacterium]